MYDIKELIEEFCNSEGHSFYGDYSGRFMYGRKCVGIVTDETPISLIASLFRFLAEESELDMCNIEDALKGAKTDNMGKNIIVYFPDIAA